MRTLPLPSRRARLAPSAALCALLLCAPPAALAVGQAQEARRELPALGDDIDAALRWLRAQQDRSSGAYGRGVEDTALALLAFGESPRTYRRGDGPFVARALDFLASRQREDGCIADPEAGEERAREQTVRAVQALTAVYDASHEAALAKALAALALEEYPERAPELAVELDSPAQVADLAGEILAARGADGAWPADAEHGAVAATAIAACRLSSAEAYLAEHRPKSAPKEPEGLPAFEPADRDAARGARERGARFLAAAALEPGRWGAPGEPDAGLSAMVLGALQTLPEPRPADVQESIDRGLAWLASLQHEDGSIHSGQMANYVTSAALMALARAERPEHAPVLARGKAFLQGLQADEGEGYSEGDRYYGGIGYGSSERPDLSNLQMALEALAAAGVESDDPTFAKALRFLERCQNRSESNDVVIAEGSTRIESGDDGGAAYMPGDSKAGFVELADGTQVPRSYGSMTYALLKCYAFAGLDREDPRVVAAWDWCRANYTLDVNPGFVGTTDPSAAYQGLYYYYSTMARALDVFGTEVLVDAAGREHAWRSELAGRLVALQSPIDGSWVNRNSARWWEGNPLLATAYALLALDAALPES